MHTIINKKFGVKSRYQDVYNMVKNIKRVHLEDKNVTIKEYENDYEQLVELL
jgi:D-serine dehydratase